MNKKKKCKFKRRSGNSHHSTNWCALGLVQFIHLSNPSPLAGLCGHCACSGKRYLHERLRGFASSMARTGLGKLQMSHKWCEVIKMNKKGIGHCFERNCLQTDLLSLRSEWQGGVPGFRMCNGHHEEAMEQPPKVKKEARGAPSEWLWTANEKVLSVGCCYCNISPWSHSRESVSLSLGKEERRKRNRKTTTTNKTKYL